MGTVRFLGFFLGWFLVYLFLGYMIGFIAAVAYSLYCSSKGVSADITIRALITLGCMFVVLIVGARNMSRRWQSIQAR